MGAEPSLAATGTAALRAELDALHPDWLLFHADAATTFPKFGSELLAFARERGYRLVALTPRCWLFRR